MMLCIPKTVPLVKVNGQNRVVVGAEPNTTLSEQVLHYGAFRKVCNSSRGPKAYASSQKQQDEKQQLFKPSIRNPRVRFFHSCNSYMQWACLAGSLTGVKRTPTQTCKHLLLPASYALVDLHLRHAVLRSTSGEILQMECRISRIRVAVLSCALVVAWHRPFKVGRVGSSNPELRNTHMVVTSPTLQGGR